MMKAHTSLVAGLMLAALLLAVPASLQGQQSDAQQHEQHHPGGAPAAPVSPPAIEPAQGQPAGMMAHMKASSARIDELVKKMNSATGTARIDAMAELLTALVEDRREHESMMGGMAGKISKMPAK